jgi:hypothetical protein
VDQNPVWTEDSPIRGLVGSNFTGHRSQPVLQEGCDKKFAAVVAAGRSGSHEHIFLPFS